MESCPPSGACRSQHMGEHFAQLLCHSPCIPTLVDSHSTQEPCSSRMLSPPFGDLIRNKGGDSLAGQPEIDAGVIAHGLICLESPPFKGFHVILKGRIKCRSYAVRSDAPIVRQRSEWLSGFHAAPRLYLHVFVCGTIHVMDRKGGRSTREYGLPKRKRSGHTYAYENRHVWSEERQKTLTSER